MAEEPQDSGDGQLLVQEPVALDDVPDSIFRSAEHLLHRHGSSWGEVSAAARIAPTSADCSEAWLIVKTSDPLVAGALVDISEAAWTGATSRMSYGAGQSAKAVSTVHVAERATVVSSPSS